MTRPRRAARGPSGVTAGLRGRRGLWFDALALVVGVATGMGLMLIGTRPETVPVAAPLPPPGTAAVSPSPAPRVGNPPVVGSTAAAPTPEPTAPLPPAPGASSAGATPTTRGTPLPARAAMAHDSPAPVAAGQRSPGARLSIGAIGIEAPITDVGVANGELVIPRDPGTVGRWRDGAQLESGGGTLLLSGHVSWNGRRGALWPLATASDGMEVHLTNASGRRTTWRITQVTAVKQGAPLHDLFRTAGPRELAIVTCGGQSRDGGYTHLVIVKARPLG